MSHLPILTMILRPNERLARSARPDAPARAGNPR
jgi:hypothetical protein